MKVIKTVFLNIFSFLILSINALAENVTVNLIGAGASFPAPLYVKWADVYQKETNKKVNYQVIGSSGGVKQIISNIVDFGASDIPLSDDKLNQKNLFQFPTVIGGIVLAINLPNVKLNELVLDGSTLSAIYLGKIRKWNSEAIVRLNPNLKLPAQDIAVVHRADSSGTSFVFTSYLSKVNPEWRSKFGIGSTINWPIGLGGKGNDGVAAFVQRLSGSIGYIEYTYAKKNNLTYTKMISANGELVNPNEDTFANAAKSVNWNKSFAQDLTNQTGHNTWPITSTTFIIIHKQQKKIKQDTEVLKFFNWAYTYGRKYANNLDYVNLPNYVVEKIRNSWKINIKDSQW